MRNQMKNTVKNQKTEYTYVEKNIYNTGVSYRVRVGSDSRNFKKLKDARAWKKQMLAADKSFIW